MVLRRSRLRVGRLLTALTLTGAVVLGVTLAALADTTNLPLPDWKVPAFESNITNPVAPNIGSTAAGGVIYARNCAQCHGTGGLGDGAAGRALDPKPYNLTSASLRQLTDGELFAMLTDGKKPMPAFNATLDARARWNVINYIRTLEPAATAPAYAASSDLRQDVSAILEPYFAMGDALAAGKYDDARGHASDISDAVDDAGSADISALPADAQAKWKASVKALQAGAQALKDAKDLASLRAAFNSMSTAVVPAVQAFGHAEAHPLFAFSCPEAQGGAGGQWVQLKALPANPYGTACPNPGLALYAASK